jgi:apolipoprotein N-acyltransferase
MVIKPNKYHLILLSLAGGLLLSVAWPEKGFAPLLFLAFIPFIALEDFLLNKRENYRPVRVFLFTYPGFLVWNILTTWWIWHSTVTGAILAWALNSLLMSLTIYLFHLTRRHSNTGNSIYFLVFFWIAFEYFHHNWEGTWPWLSLGNGFGSWNQWIQWYEYTGIFGGTFWIILVNILIYQFLKFFFKEENRRKAILILIPALLLIVLPIILSYSLYNRYQEKSWPVDVLVIQPNVDPYNEQYTLSSYELVSRNLNLARSVMDGDVEFVVSPESALQENIWEDRIETSHSLDSISAFLKSYPSASYVIGASTYRLFKPGEELSATARRFRDMEGHYDAYNTAIFLDTSVHIGLHHKSKLTPGVEKMPFARLMKPLENLAFDLGGTVGSLGIDPERTVFMRRDDSLKIAPVICYESVFGSYVTQYVRKGANLIFVITNDGWWGNTPGHRQHLAFSRIRAIETRRSIARSANTGISAFIDQRGDLHQATSYWNPAVIRQKINANDKVTFYVLHGDYIARLSAFTSVFLLLIAISLRLRKKPSL